MLIVDAYAKLILVTVMTIKAVQSVNIALGKPAYQSSVTSGGSPSKAVDGDSNSDFFGGSCIHTLHGKMEQWWIVDLQGVYVITDVWIQNRNSYPYLHDFVVDVFPLNPVEVSEEGKMTCSNYSGVAPNTKIHLACETGTRGRYVRLLKLPEFITNPSIDTLIICEVLVGTLSNFRPCASEVSVSNSADSSKTSSNQKVQGLTRVECFHQCYYDYNCNGFNYRESDGSCQIITDQDQPVVVNTEWTYYPMY